MPLIDTRTDGDIGTIILDHLERRNALSRQLVDAIVETLQKFCTKEYGPLCCVRGPA